MYLPEEEMNAVLSLIEEKMMAANKSLGDSRSEVKGEAKKVLQRILQSSENREDLSEKLVKIFRNLESVTPASKAAWFMARSSLVKRKLDMDAFSGAPDAKKAAGTLLKEKDTTKLKKKAGDIAKVQGFLKSMKPKDSALLNDCSEMLLNLLRLPAGSPQQGQIVSELIARLRQVPIDKHMWDTILSAYDGTAASMQITIKMISTALSAQLVSAAEVSAESTFEGSKLNSAMERSLERQEFGTVSFEA
jgi:hypothetical protein